VAQILADLGMGPLVVAAGLLHDTVEDTDYTLDECRAEFGDTVTGFRQKCRAVGILLDQSELDEGVHHIVDTGL
jgi:(p)ppGpp synthase/HD superfamily hydrolase